MPDDLFGILNLAKPANVTSRAVVDVVQRLVRPAKAGHAGTLDPLARGVVVVCLGRATRLIPFVQQAEKVYRGRFRLGLRSNTDDVTGQITETPGVTPVSAEQLAAVLPAFVGEIQQVPPQFSAVHVDGKRAYKLARRGQHVEISARAVVVHRIELVDFGFPDFELEIDCGSGTYIRSIGRDIGERLRCGAVMTSLTRTRIGPYRLEDAVAPEELDQQSLAEHVRSAAEAVAGLPVHQCSEEELEEIVHGRKIVPDEAAAFAQGAEVALLDPSGGLAALALYRRQDNSLGPKQVFLPRRD
ncbi:MAG: tRNA pseudouridine(55) synthase TruB [Planctomycetaceae bacterium]|nr:tRNA pseudouridine(55) synthase TruB [Planctomycetaceae bacterium]